MYLTGPTSQVKILVIEYWNLEFICNLVLGIWNLKVGILAEALHQVFYFNTKPEISDWDL